MVLDTSAIIAIILDEPETEISEKQIADDPLRVVVEPVELIFGVVARWIAASLRSSHVWTAPLMQGVFADLTNRTRAVMCPAC